MKIARQGFLAGISMRILFTGSTSHRRLDLHRIVRMLDIPERDQLLGGLTDILTVDDRACQRTGHIQAIRESCIGAILDIEVPSKPMLGVQVPKPSILTGRPERRFSMIQSRASLKA